MKRYTIIYKSGAKVRVRADNLEVIRFGNGRIKISWDKIRPRAFLVGVDDIAAVWPGRV
jgi:hypothetical protein